MTAEALCADSIRGALPQELSDADIYVFDCVDSTNSYARQLALEGKKCALVLAEEQRAGRGRQGRSFFSPRGTGLYMSLLLPLQGQTQLLTIAAADAVCAGLERLCGISPKIKWVNDIYLEGRKLCGILCESVSLPEAGGQTGVVIGIGVNCSTQSFPPELCGIAGSLGQELSRNLLCAELCTQLMRTLSLDTQAVLCEYRSRSLMEGRRVAFQRNGKEMQAVAQGISDDGSLIVMSGCGERIYLSSGEVSVKGLGDWK